MSWARRAALVAVMAAAPAASGPPPAHAAAGTTCLCRTDDGKGFRETTHRHHRWACDFKLGYVPQAKAEGAGKEDAPEPKTRPAGQTCNAEEIVQYKVWACMERGCTYPYAKAMAQKNRALEGIETLKGKRTP